MGKSSKKSGTKVNAAAAVAAPAKAMKKGKREAEEAIDNRSAKKQNKDGAVEQAVEKQKSQVMAQKKNKKDETISSQESPSSDSQEENKVKVPIKKGGIPAKELVKESGSEDSQDSSSDDEPAIKKVVPSKKLPEATGKNGTLKKAKLSSSSDDSDSLKDGDFEDEETYTKVNSQAKELPKPAPKSAAIVPPKKDSGDDTSEESETDEGSSDEDEGNQVSKKTSGSDEEYSEDEEKSSEDEVESSEDEEDQASKVSKKKVDITTLNRTDTDVEMVDATAAKVKPKNKNSVSEMKSTPTPLTTHAQVSKTLFVGNLPFSVEQAHVKNFFKECGEIVEVRFAMDKEGGFKGFGHIEFANARAAQKALELSGKKLLGRALRIDFAMERGSYTPNSGKENSNQKGENAQRTVYIRGFDQNAAEDNMRTLLEEHFGSCGEISRMSIPKGDDALRGYAYIDFTSSDGFSKALELHGSELEGYTLTVEEARPRGDKSFGGGRGGSGGRSGGRGGRRGGRGAGGRFGGGGGGRGGRGRGTRQT